MPWKETCAMDERLQFVAAWLSGGYTKTALCAAYGISRPTGDKWLARYREEGAAGLLERARAPYTHPNAVSETLQAMILKTKHTHPSFGPKKVMDWLRRDQPHRRWPADSTAGELLKRAGLVKPRRHRHRVAADPNRLAPCDQPNASWSADFKGDFRASGGNRCYPLTVTDNYSRYLLLCRGLERTGVALVRPWFERVFHDYGLPAVIRTDNGAPFASRALGGLSALSKWWVDLGIRPERIRPGAPTENARHERMHRTLKDAAIGPGRLSLVAQQRRFDAFLAEYNWQRSHEALRRQTPGSLYRCSHRPYPGRIEPAHYGSDSEVRHVRQGGEIRWRTHLYYLSEVLAREAVGLKPIAEGQWEVRYRFHLIGILDERSRKVTPPREWHQPRD